MSRRSPPKLGLELLIAGWPLVEQGRPVHRALLTTGHFSGACSDGLKFLFVFLLDIFKKHLPRWKQRLTCWYSLVLLLLCPGPASTLALSAAPELVWHLPERVPVGTLLGFGEGT